MTKEIDSAQIKKDKVRKKLNAELDIAIENLTETLALAEKLEKEEELEAIAKQAIEDLKANKSKI